jgi:hypothetical protein
MCQRETEINIGRNIRQKEKANVGCDKKKD